MKLALIAADAKAWSRAPHGARGLKRRRHAYRRRRLPSRPARGARIETLAHDDDSYASCRAPHGARGLKLTGVDMQADGLLVAPRTGRAD